MKWSGKGLKRMHILQLYVFWGPKVKMILELVKDVALIIAKKIDVNLYAANLQFDKLSKMAQDMI
eukprot:15030657-Ditylum_brightwellii.AAC.1